jgi:hypothetical protein
MRTFQQYLEAVSAQASVANFPQDFENILNLITGGSWMLSDSKETFGGFDQDLNQSLSMGIDATYRGMSENGRHYKISVSITDRMYQQRAKLGRKFTSYNPQGSADDIERQRAGDVPFVFFVIDEIWELGKDAEMNHKLTPETRWVDFKKTRSLTPTEMAKRLKEAIDKHEQQNGVPQSLFKPGQSIMSHDEKSPQDPANWWKDDDNDDPTHAADWWKK